MFWGLIMEPQKKYTQTVKKAFHISMASLDNSSATDDVVQVMCGYESRKYLLCTLQKDKILQVPLDLNFDVGTEVSFVTNGKSYVHLSGYLVQDEDMFGDSQDEEEDEEADVSLGNVTTSNIVSGKRAKGGKAEGQQNGLSIKLSKKLTELAKDAPAAKKLKTADLLQDVNEEDDEDDSDVDLSDLLAEEDDDEEGDVTMDDDEDVDDEEDEDDDEDEEDSDEDDEMEGGEEVDDDGENEEESEAEEDEVFEMAPQNGLAKKSKAKEQEKKAAKKEAKAKMEPKSPKDAKSPKEPKTPKEPKSPKEGKTKMEAKSPRKVEGGVQIEDVRVGNGASAKVGKMLQLYYEGRFKSGKMFDSATKGAGFKFRLGRGEVIKGWDVGLVGMKVGGKRRLVCPANMAYGAKGSPPTIPPNSTLVFEVELKNVS